MKEQILNQLAQIENEDGVKILYACESGSRAWGFPSKDSDYDVRFIYHQPLKEYLRIVPNKDVIERPINNLLDINGWDIGKALSLFGRSNAPIMEWVRSPIVYRQNEGFLQKIRNLMPDFFSAAVCFYHYRGLAIKNYELHLQSEAVKLKKYFYSLRPILACQWLEKGMGPVPVEFDIMVQSLVTDTDLKNELITVQSEKLESNESDLQTRNSVFDAFIKSEIERLKDVTCEKEKAYVNYSKLDDFIYELLKQN